MWLRLRVVGSTTWKGLGYRAAVPPARFAERTERGARHSDPRVRAKHQLLRLRAIVFALLFGFAAEAQQPMLRMTSVRGGRVICLPSRFTGMGDLQW